MPRFLLEGVKRDIEIIENPLDEFEETYRRSLAAIRAFNAHQGGLMAALAAIAAAQDVYLRSKRGATTGISTPNADVDDYGWG